MLGLCEAEDGEPLGGAAQGLNIEECKNAIFVCSTPSVVHDLFYLLLKLNQLHHENVRNDNTRITQFDINNMTIQENTSYHDVDLTIQTINVGAGDAPYIYIYI